MSRVLLDCDGVIADWTGAVAEVIKNVSGLEMDRTKWFNSKDLPKQYRFKVMGIISGEGFCRSFNPLPGAIEAIKELRGLGHDVHFVTSMWDCKSWVFDRNVWLVKHKLCDAPGGVTYTKDKYVVYGDYLVDDKISNVQKWQLAWPDKTGIVWAQPWNAEYSGGLRMNNWDELIRLVESSKS